MGKCPGQNDTGNERDPREGISPDSAQSTMMPRSLPLCSVPRPWCGACRRALRLASLRQEAAVEGCITPRLLPTWIFTISPFSCLQNRTAPHSPRPGPTLPALVLGDPALTVPTVTGAGPRSTQRAARGGRSPGEQPGPVPGRAVGTKMAPGPWQGGRGHCSSGGWPWASPHGYQWDRAAHTGSRPELHRGGTHVVIQMTVLWSPRREMGCPLSISREMLSLNWHQLP